MTGHVHEVASDFIFFRICGTILLFISLSLSKNWDGVCGFGFWIPFSTRVYT